ncbi:MAG: hypothetical protein ABFC80_09525 [Coriobacteriales bacterium]|nr:hypothetical protein [Actinomycetes bacterium]
MNPRQVALAVWAVLAIIWALTQPKIRRSFGAVFQTVANPKLLIPALASIAWNAAVLFCLFRLHLWSPALWWDTAVFMLGGTTALVWRMSESKDYSWRFYRQVIFEAFTVSFLLGVLASNYTFTLLVELILVPWLVILGALKAVASSDAKYSAVAKLVDGLIGITGFAMLLQMIVGAVAQDSGFWSLLTVQSLLLVVLLTAAYLPFMIGIRAWIAYETAFIPLRLGDKKPLSVRLRAQLKMVLRHRLDLAALERFRTGPGYELLFGTTREAVDAVFESG